jgi:glycosyltransferase involved in cell wall biosynthesis
MRGGQRIRVAFLTRYDRSRASSRVRVYDYLPHLQRMGFECRILPFPRRLTTITKVRYLLNALWLARWADVVVLQKLVLREAFVSAVKKANPRIVFDFDDALWAVPDALQQNSFAQIRHQVQTQRLQHIFAHACCVIAGSNYLANYAKNFALRVEVIPSSVDLESYPLKENWSENPVVLGWIGSPENLIDFIPILPVLRELVRMADELCIKVVSTCPPKWNGFPFLFEQWKLGQDVTYLHSFDIGLMPLNDTERSRGRCAFKAIQYMAVGLPVVASPIGAASEVIMHGETGFLATSIEEWVEYLSLLVKNKPLRTKMGKAGRARVESLFSIQANAPKLASLLREVALL